MSSISAVSAAPPHHPGVAAKPKSGKPDGDGDHGVEPSATASQVAASKPGGVSLTA